MGLSKMVMERATREAAAFFIQSEGSTVAPTAGLLLTRLVQASVRR